MGYQPADIAGAMRQGFDMGQSFAQPLVDALQQRAWKKQNDQVVAQVQAQLNELKQQGITDHAAYEEMLVRLNAGEEVSPDEIQNVGRRSIVSAMLYQQRAMELVNNSIMANPTNPLLQKSLGGMASQMQADAERAMAIGKMLHEEGMAEEQAANEEAWRKKEFDADENRFTRTEERLTKDSDRSFQLQQAELGERRADRAENARFRERSMALDEARFDMDVARSEREELRVDEEMGMSRERHGMAKETHAVDIAERKRASALGGITDTLQLRDVRSQLIDQGAEDTDVDQFLLDNGIDRAELDRIKTMSEDEAGAMDEAAAGLGEESAKTVKAKQTRLKRVEEILEEQRTRKSPNKERISLLQEEARDLKAEIRKELDKAADVEVRGARFKKNVTKVVDEFREWIGRPDPMKQTNQPEPMQSTEME
jgi:hypothetical protein